MDLFRRNDAGEADSKLVPMEMSPFSETLASQTSPRNNGGTDTKRKGIENKGKREVIKGKRHVGGPEMHRLISKASVRPSRRAYLT